MMIENYLKCLIIFGFDFIFANIFICNFVCFVWRIIWDTQDLYLKSNLYLNSFISVLVYFALIVIVKLEQIKSIHKKHKNQHDNFKCKSKLVGPNWKKKFKLKIFILVFSFANINHWRGVWNFTIHYTNESTIGIFTIGGLSFMGLIALKRVCAVMAVPFCIEKDCKNTAFQIDANSRNIQQNLNLDKELQVKLILKIIILNVKLKDVFWLKTK
jgi:hypothetical protein